MFEQAEKYQQERDKIIKDNNALHNEVEEIKSEYKDKEFELEWKYKNKIRGLEKENKHLSKIVDTFKSTIKNFIKWICKKFDITDGNKLERDFEKETGILLDAEKQVKKDEKAKNHDFELEL